MAGKPRRMGKVQRRVCIKKLADAFDLAIEHQQTGRAHGVRNHENYTYAQALAETCVDFRIENARRGSGGQHQSSFLLLQTCHTQRQGAGGCR